MAIFDYVNPVKTLNFSSYFRPLRPYMILKGLRPPYLPFHVQTNPSKTYIFLYALYVSKPRQYDNSDMILTLRNDGLCGSLCLLRGPLWPKNLANGAAVLNPIVAIFDYVNPVKNYVFFVKLRA